MAGAYVVLRRGSRPEAELEIRKSTFLSYAARVTTEAEARDFLAEIRSIHPQARHICHGFVCEPTRTIQRSSDDGEPAGTAGAPIMTALMERTVVEGLHLSDVVVGVVRYFGGIKLGVGGLIQAYSDATVAVLSAAQYRVRQPMRITHLETSYTEAPRIETSLRASGTLVSDTQYGADGVTITLAIPDEDEAFDTLAAQVAQWTSGQAHLEVSGLEWRDTPLPT